MPSSDSIVLIAALAGVFGTLLIAFTTMLCCCTWRSTRHFSTSSAYHSRFAHSCTEKQLLAVAKNEHLARWSTNRRNGERTARSTRSFSRAVNELGVLDEEKNEQYADVELTSGEEAQPVDNATEWGAKIGKDGTRSYLNGWFSLNTPLAGQRQALRNTRYRDDSDEDWDARSHTSDDGEDGDVEAYRGSRTI